MKSIYFQVKYFIFLVLVTSSISLYSQASTPPLLRLLMNTTSFNDETVFYFQKGGTTGFQSDFDAYKLVFNPGVNPYMGSLSDSILTSINGLPELPSSLSIPVKAITPVSKTFTFSTDISEFSSFVCVTLFDAFTGISTNILTSNYVCTLYDTTSIARFTLNFSTTPLNVLTNVLQKTCFSTAGGKIIASVSGTGPLNYEWRKNDSTLKIVSNVNCTDSLYNLTGGQYTVRINELGTCGYFSKIFTVDSIISSTANFTSQNLNNPNQVNFTNKSSNNQSSTWIFGDNSEISHSTHPTHYYSNPGTYTVTLISESPTGCSDTSSQTIKVLNPITGVSSYNKNNPVLLATHTQGNYELKFSFDAPENIEISIRDMKGSLLKKISLEEISFQDQWIDMDSFSSGMYLLNVSSNKNTSTTFKIIK